MGWSCSMHEEMRNVYKPLIGEPELKRSLGRYWRR